MDYGFAEGGETSGVEKEVSRQVQYIKGQLRDIYSPQWRKELEGLYDE